MKILWLSMSPCGATQLLQFKSKGTGWLVSLEQELIRREEIDLHVCFHWETDLKPFNLDNVSYYPVRRVRQKNILLGKVLGKHFRLDPVKSYLDVISRVKPDLIHIHGTEEAFGLVQHFTDIPVIISLQGILTNICSHYFSGVSVYRFIVHEKLIEHLHLRSVLAVYIIFKANAKREQKILSRAEDVMGRTEWDRRSSLILAPRARYHHGDEVLRNVFYNNKWEREKFSNPIRIVTISNVAPYKGYEAIIKVAKLLASLDSFNFVWNVVGLSEDDKIVEVVHKAFGAQDDVKLLGSRNDIEVCSILMDSDIYCQVSHIENSPNSLCEAMILGMPIIATFAGGTDSILCNKNEGILVQDGDYCSFAGAVVEMSRDFEHATNMGNAARNRALSRHNPYKIVSDLLDTYRDVINRQKSRREVQNDQSV